MHKVIICFKSDCLNWIFQISLVFVFFPDSWVIYTPLKTKTLIFDLLIMGVPKIIRKIRKTNTYYKE